jgi:hypothetical protein
MSTSSVLHAGNCGPDTWALEGLLKELGVAHISSAESIAEVEQLLQSESFSLVLLNRVFDSTGELALDLLQRLPAEQRANCMLISNYPDEAAPDFHQAALFRAFPLPGSDQPCAADPISPSFAQRAGNRSH